MLGGVFFLGGGGNLTATFMNINNMSETHGEKNYKCVITYKK